MKNTLDIHIVSKDGKFFVFHPTTLKLFSVTEEIGMILKFYEIRSKDIRIIAEKLYKSEQYITDILNYISDNTQDKFVKDLEWSDGGTMVLNLMISQDCNLKCAYCYADHGAYGREKKLMNFDIAKKSIDTLLKNVHDKRIVFFGGEPFLNFSLMKELDSHLITTGINAKYTTVTNGTIMNEEIKNFINKNFFNLCISLDGTKDTNDQHRYGNVESVHDCVLKTISMLEPRNYSISIKSVVTKRSLNDLKDNIEYINSLNIDSMAAEPVHYMPHESDLFLSDADLAKYIQEMIKINVDQIRKMANGEKVVFMSHIFDILWQIMTKTRKINMCSGGRESITITADGDVYPCHMYIGVNEFMMGNVNDADFPGDRFKKIRDLFKKINIYNSSDCNSCWARFLCGGECAWLSDICNNDLSRPTEQRCALMKSILDALLPEIADIFQDEIKTRNLINSLKTKKEIMPQSLC
jgi:uncharacterized protein